MGSTHLLNCGHPNRGKGCLHCIVVKWLGGYWQNFSDKKQNGMLLAREKNVGIYRTSILESPLRLEFLIAHSIKSTILVSIESSYSRVSNKRAANLIVFGRNSYLHGLISSYMFIYFWEKYPPTRLFHPTRLCIHKCVGTQTCRMNKGLIPIFLLFCLVERTKLALKSTS